MATHAEFISMTWPVDPSTAVAIGAYIENCEQRVRAQERQRIDDMLARHKLALDAVLEAERQARP